MVVARGPLNIVGSEIGLLGIIEKSSTGWRECFLKCMYMQWNPVNNTTTVRPKFIYWSRVKC
jgi:hypothetical protein